MAERPVSSRPVPSRLAEGSMLGAGVIVALALFAMVNYLALRHYQRFDWTSSELYTLSEKSKNVVAGIDRDVDAIVFLAPGSETFEQVDELLSRYEAASPRLRKRVIDPARNRLEAQRLIERFGIERADVIVLAAGDDRRVIDELDLVEYDYAGAQFGQAPAVAGFKGEQLITSAILELVEDRKPRVLVLSGHGEASLDGGAGGAGGGRGLRAAEELLGGDNVALETWSSLGASTVPEDADLLIVAGPRSRFLEPELAIFDDYLRRGGRMLFLLDPVFAETGVELLDLGLDAWLRGYGVALERAVVFDPEQQLPLYGAETIFTARYGIHPIVESLEQTGRPVLMPVARPVRRAADAPEDHRVTELVLTSDQAWGETALATLPDVEPDGDDPRGPLALGVAVSFPASADGGGLGDRVGRADVGGDGSDGGDGVGDVGDEPDSGDENGVDEADSADGADPADEADPADGVFDDPGGLDDDAADDDETPAEGRLVVYGDFDFASDTQVVNGANAALLLNTLNWLIEREQLLAIEPRRPEQTRLLLSSDELLQIYLLVLVLMPGLAITAGVWVFFRRRR